jgi:Peptidase M15
MDLLTEEQFLNFFSNYKGLPGQQKGVLALRRQILSAKAGILASDSEWIKDYRDNPEPELPAKITPGSPFKARLTPHIQLGEFALFQEARRFDCQHQVDTAAELAAFLERCRKQFGGNPLIITSGYRPPAINRSVGGASGSEHLYSAPGVGAVDFYVKNVSIQAVQDWCDDNWSYSLGYGAPKGFVHLGIRGGRPRVRWDY